MFTIITLIICFLLITNIGLAYKFYYFEKTQDAMYEYILDLVMNDVELINKIDLLLKDSKQHEELHKNEENVNALFVRNGY